MSNTQHTPGPWRSAKEYANRWKIYTEVDGFLPVSLAFVTRTVCETGADVDGMCDANARLIAAAPDSHACNTSALWWLEHPAIHDVFRGDKELYAKLEATILAHRAAIAKAGDAHCDRKRFEGHEPKSCALCHVIGTIQS